MRRQWAKLQRAIDKGVASAAVGGQLQRSIAIRAKAVHDRAEVQTQRAELLRRKTQGMERLATRRAGLQQAARAMEAEMQQLSIAVAGGGEKGRQSEVQLAQLTGRHQQAIAALAELDRRIDEDVRVLSWCCEWVLQPLIRDHAVT